MDFFHLVSAALASSAVVEFFRHSQLVSEWRLYFNTTTYFTSRLMRCGFCLSHWTAAFVFLFFLSPGLVFPASRWALVLSFPVHILAIVRLSNLINDLTHGFRRSPRREEDELTSEAPHGS